MSTDMPTSSTPMPAFRSHKKIWALEISKVIDKGTDSTTDENPLVEVHFVDPVFAPRTFNLHGKPTPEAGWYFVQYENGYNSFSPADAFVNGHTPIDPADNPHGAWHGIGWAVKQMQDGMLVCRAGWNGKGMFLFLVPGSQFKVNRLPLLDIYEEGTDIDYCPHVDMKMADGKIVPWLASQTDLLAFDWEIAE